MSQKKKSRARQIKALPCKRKTVKSGVVDGGEIKRRREAAKLTQAAAARAAGWATAQNWSNVENAKPAADPQVSTLRRVADVLGCKVDDLLRK